MFMRLKDWLCLVVRRSRSFGDFERVSRWFMWKGSVWEVVGGRGGRGGRGGGVWERFRRKSLVRVSIKL